MRRKSISLAVIAVIGAAATTAVAQTKFTYQGRLDQNGTLANGLYDFGFTLHDALAGGNQIGTTFHVFGVQVTDGLFTTEVVLGLNLFDGGPRWLEIIVRQGTPNWTPLSPRQPLTAVPYAMYAFSGPGAGGGLWDANGVDIFNNNSGNVGIGTTMPTQKLDVHGIMAVTDPGSSPLGSVIAFGSPTGNIGMTMERGDGAGGQLRRWDYLIASDASLRFQDRTSGNDRLVIDTGGNIGIGTTAPAARLHVAGVAGVDGVMFPDGTLQTTAAGSGGGLWSANGNDIYYNNGDVGIGITAPAFNLHTKKFVFSGSFQPAATFGLQWSQATIPATNDWLSFRVGGTFLVPVGQDGTHIIRKSGEKLHFSVEDTMNSGSLTPQLTLSANGQLGIGTTTPDEKLHVVGGATTAIFGTTSSTSGEYGVHGESLSTTGGSGVFGVGRYGVLGIANTLNGYGGVFSGAGPFGSGPSLWAVGDALVSAGLRIGSAGVFNAATVKLQVENGSDASLAGGGFAVFGDFAGPNIGIDDNEIMARNNGAASTLFINHNGGDVHIGQGGGSTTVFVPVLAITGADIAERFPTSEDAGAIEPGMVMEIDPSQPGKLRVARGAYNRRVAGVVSGAGDIPTGATLGNLPGYEDAPPVALSGRVWVYCDASETAIELGDLLTTSATPGHAMAVRDFTRSPGATLGKAMTRLCQGETGLVLVLVNLQ